MARVNGLDRTTLWTLLVGSACLALGVYGTVCQYQNEICPLKSQSIGMMLEIVGFGTLIPLLMCIVAFIMDIRSEENIPLLSPRAANSLASEHRLWVYLYMSHFFVAWLFPANFLPNIFFQMVVYVVLVLTMPFLGRYVDQTNRWIVIQSGLFGVLSMTWISAGAFSALVLFEGEQWYLYTCFASILGASALGQMFNDLQTLSIEKDWIVELAMATDTSLAQWNTTLLRIDLTTRILSPMAFTFFLDLSTTLPLDLNHRVLSLLLGLVLWSTLLFPLSYAMLADVHTFCPALSAKKRKKTTTSISYTQMWAMYFQHPTFLVSFSFCALYMTVLKENALSSAYLIWHGTSASVVAWSMASGAYLGLLSSFAFPFLLRWWQYAETVAIVSVWSYVACLLPALITFILSPTTSDILLMIVIAISQFWLWSTSLAETQIMQEWVQTDRRGIVNAMQHTVNKGFYIAILLLGTVYSNPTQFFDLVGISILAGIGSAIGISLWYHRFRDA